MNNFTINSIEMKRDIVNFVKKFSNECDKPESKFIMDILWNDPDKIFISIAKSNKLC